MAAPSTRGMIQAGLDIMNTTVDAVTRKINAQLGSVHDDEADSAKAEWWQQYGFASRPPRPDKGKASAQAIVIKTGDYDLCIASQDLRGLELYGNLDYGEVCIYSAGEDGKGQARMFWKKDGSISAYTRKGNTSSGDGMLFNMDPVSGSVRLLNDLGMGMVADQDEVTLTAGDASLTLGKDGSASLIATKRLQMDGSTVIVGSTVTPLNSALTGLTGVSGKASVKVFIE